jgi:hypothetical protein
VKLVNLDERDMVVDVARMVPDDVEGAEVGADVEGGDDSGDEGGEEE